MSDENVEIGVTADTDGAVRAVADLKKEFSNFAKDMKEHSEKMTEKLGGIVEKFDMVKKAILSVAAGGAFSEIIKEANEFVSTVSRLGVVLGISLQAATELNVGLRLVGMEAEQYTGLLQRMTLQVRNNEARLNSLGVVTRDTAGHFQDSSKVMQSALKTLDQYKEGTDRNLAATELFGRNWAAVLPLLRLNDEMMQRAKQDTLDLGLAVSDTAKKDVREYKVALAEVNLVFEGMGKVIAEELLPHLTNLAKHFRETGPTTIHQMETAVRGLVTAFMFLVNTYQTLLVLNLALVDEFTELISGLGAVVRAAAHLDWKGMKEGFSNAVESMKLTAQQAAAQIHDIWAETTDAPEAAAKKPKGTKEYTKKDKGGAPSQVSEWKDQLEEEHLANTNLLEDTTRADLKFWEDKVDRAGLKEKEILAIKQMIYGLKKKIAMEEYQEEIAGFQQSLTEARGAAEKKAQIESNKLALVLATYKEDSKEYRAQFREKTNADREYHDFQIQLQTEEITRASQHKVSVLNAAMEIAKGKKDIGQMTALQLAQFERQNAAEIYQIQSKALKDKLALLEKDKQETKQVKDELGKLEDAYNIEVIKANNKVHTEVYKTWETMLSAISNAFETSIKGMILGTTTFKKAMSNIFLSIGGEFLNMAVKAGKDWIATEVTKTLATEAGVAARLAAEQAGGAAGLLSMVGFVFKAIMADAAKAFSGVWASLSGIPFVGPEMAAVAAPAAYGLVAGMASAVTAEGGYDIPSGVNPFVRAHAREMILPANLADKVRNMTSDGAGDFHYHDHTGSLDDSMIERKSRKIAKAMNMQARNFYRGT